MNRGQLESSGIGRWVWYGVGVSVEVGGDGKEIVPEHKCWSGQLCWRFGQ